MLNKHESIRSERKPTKKGTRIVKYYVFKCNLCFKELFITSGNIPRHSGFCFSCSIKTKRNLPDGFSRCAKCRVVKISEGNFPFLPAKNRYQSYCYTCAADYARERQRGLDRTPEFFRIRKRYSLKSKSGLDIEQYDKMMEDQKGLCDVCGLPETTKINGKQIRLSVDHDHKCCPGERSCGKCVRSLLCSRCNSALGYLNDSPERVLSLLGYLEKHATK